MPIFSLASWKVQDNKSVRCLENCLSALLHKVFALSFLASGIWSSVEPDRRFRGTKKTSNKCYRGLETPYEEWLQVFEVKTNN